MYAHVEHTPAPEVTTSHARTADNRYTFFKTGARAQHKNFRGFARLAKVASEAPFLSWTVQVHSRWA